MIIKIILICLLTVAIVFGTVVAVSYFPRRIQQVFPGIELLMTGESEYEILQTMEIRIDGRIRYGLFASHPLFEGSFEVSAYDFTLDVTHIGIHFPRGFGIGGWMTYPFFERIMGSAITRPRSLGMLHTDEDFSSLVIHLTEWIYIGEGSHQGQQGNRVIAAPATDSNSALEVLRSNSVFRSDELGIVRYWYFP